MGLVNGLTRTVWWRWLALSWISKAFSVALLIYAIGWIVGNLGWNEMARDLGVAALYIAAFPVTALVMRGLWRSATAHHRR